jgi:hypothetical protein
VIVVVEVVGCGCSWHFVGRRFVVVVRSAVVQFHAWRGGAV